MTKNKLHKKQPNNFIKWSCLFFSACTLGLAFYTLHDLQTAEGVGLYLSMVLDYSDRTIFDILVDILGMLFFFIALLLPCTLFKHRTSEAFFRMLALYVAFMPIVHPGTTVHLNHTLANLQCRQSLADGNVLIAITESFIEISPVLQLLLPTLALFCAVNFISGYQFFKMKYVIIFILNITLYFIHLFYPDLTQECSYFMHYVLLICLFREFEQLCKHYETLSNRSLILFGGCLLRGIYRMIELMSITQL